MEQGLNIGVDVAKQTVMVACARGSFACKQIPNRRAELKVWLATLPAGSRIGVESTGEHHELLAQRACARGLTVFVLNPRDVRHYARAVGLRGKTDRVDAQLIARYIAGEHSRLKPWVAPSPEQRQIDRLLKRRAHVSRTRAALCQSLQGEKALAGELAALKRQFDAVLHKIDAKLAKLVAASPERETTCQQLSSIYGFGPLLGAYLATLFERVSFPDINAFVAFTGYDPRPNDSGYKIGRRRLSKRGPAELRRLLFLAAMNWSKSKQGRPLYEHYRQRGLPTTAALVVLARKLARGKDFDLEDLRAQLTQLQGMGGVAALIDKLPAQLAARAGELPQGNQKDVARQIAIICSMTPGERRFPKSIDGSRKRRIAAGSGVQVADVNRLLRNFLQMQKMMKGMGKGGLSRMMRAMGGRLPPGLR